MQKRKEKGTCYNIRALEKRKKKTKKERKKLSKRKKKDHIKSVRKQSISSSVRAGSL